MRSIDLHGMFVKQSLELVEEVLQQCLKTPGKFCCIRKLSNLDLKLLTIITGAGNHSEGGRARIKPAGSTL